MSLTVAEYSLLFVAEFSRFYTDSLWKFYHVYLGNLKKKMSNFASDSWSIPCVAMTSVSQYFQRYLALLIMSKDSLDIKISCRISRESDNKKDNF